MIQQNGTQQNCFQYLIITDSQLSEFIIPHFQSINVETHSKKQSLHKIVLSPIKQMKSAQALINNQYLYSPSQPLRQSQSLVQYRAYDKLTKQEFLLQIHQTSDYLLDSLRLHNHAFLQFIVDKFQFQDGQVAYFFESGVQSTLQQALLKVNHLNEEDALVIFKYILLMVKEIHQKQLIIERLCLQNILICNYALFKLGHLTLQSSNDYALEYWSPQRLQDKQMTFQSDVYALGVMLYKLLYGIFPFKADSKEQMIKKIKGRKFQVPETKSPLQIVISREVHYLVLSMLDFYDQNRPDLSTILSNSCFSSIDIETDVQKYLKPKGAMVPESFQRKYLIYRPTKILTRYQNYYSQSTYLMFNLKQKTFMTLYIPKVRMFEAQPRKIESYLQKIRGLQKNYKPSACNYLVKVNDIERFRNQPILVTAYCNQGNLFNYIQKRKVFKGWLNEPETNVIMYLLAIALKQMKTLGVESIHTVSHQRVMISDNTILLREPGILTPLIQKTLTSSQNIDFFAPELKEKMDFVELNKTDIWSFGIMYVYLLSGEMPKLNQENHIDLTFLKANKKNINIIAKCLDYNVKKRIELQNIKMDTVDQALLNNLMTQTKLKQKQKERLLNSQNLQGQQDDDSIDPNELLNQNDLNSANQQIYGNKRSMLKKKEKRMFSNYNKTICQSTTTPCRLIVKTMMGLVILWVVFFGIFFINGGMGLLRTNFYRKITLQVPYNYGTSLYNLTILSTNGPSISQKYTDLSYEQFIYDMRCFQNIYSPNSTNEVWSFINETQSVYCFFGFIWAILLSVIYIIQVYKLDLPTVLYKRRKTSYNKELFHFIVFNSCIIPSLMFTFFYTFAFQYIIQMAPCLGLQNLAYPKFTSVEAVLNGDMKKFFLNVFLTVILWAILMFFYGFASIFWKIINSFVYQWVGIISFAVVMLTFTLICRIGFGMNSPIEPTWSYKMNLDITSKYYGLFGFFPQILWLAVVLLSALVDLVFWVFQKIQLTPQQQQDITGVQGTSAKFQRLETKQKEIGNEKSNIYMIDNTYEFERFD